MVYHKLKEKYADQGVIFDDMSNALREHGELVRKYFIISLLLFMVQYGQEELSFMFPKE